MKLLRFLPLLLWLGVGCIAHAGSFEQFFKALQFDDDRATRMLLVKGFDPNTLSEEGQPAISYAMAANAEKSVRVLLMSGNLNVNQGDMRGDTPLMVACALNNSSWVSALIAKGAHLDRPSQWSPLHYAAGSGSLSAIELLVKAGANLNARSSNGTTPLMMAARENKEDAARLLLKLGADPRPVNQSDYNAAGYAMRENNKPLALDIMRAEKEIRGKKLPTDT